MRLLLCDLSSDLHLMGLVHRMIGAKPMQRSCLRVLCSGPHQVRLEIRVCDRRASQLGPYRRLHQRAAFDHGGDRGRTRIASQLLLVRSRFELLLLIADLLLTGINLLLQDLIHGFIVADFLLLHQPGHPHPLTELAIIRLIQRVRVPVLAFVSEFIQSLTVLLPYVIHLELGNLLIVQICVMRAPLVEILSAQQILLPLIDLSIW